MNQDTISLLLGPLGLTAGLLFFVWLLITEKVVPAGRLKASVDREVEARQATKDALALVDSSNQAMERMSDAVEARNKLEAERLAIEKDRLARATSRSRRTTSS